MKKLVLLLGFLFVLVACTDKDKEHSEHKVQSKKQLYTCPMHPEVISDKPGNCPKCGMYLVPKETKNDVKKGVAIEDLLTPTNEFVISTVPVVSVKKESNLAMINALGKVEYDTRQIGSISSRIAGRIEKLYVRYKYQKVSKGQRVLDIYSPELLTAQQNLLFLVKNDPSNKMMIDAAKQKLILLGIPDANIQRIIKKGKPELTLPIFSYYTGHIHKASASGTMGDGSSQPQNEMATASYTTDELPLKEGMYVQKGQNIFNIYNSNRTWVLLNIFPQDINLVSKGQSVTIIPESNPENKLKGTIGFIEPFFRNGSKTLTVRVYFNNNVAKIPIGSQVRAEIAGHSRLSDWLPKSAVISLGINKVVFKKVTSGFIAHKVVTGVTINNKIEIVSGLQHNDTVAENAQYLMDSESFIKTEN